MGDHESRLAKLAGLQNQTETQHSDTQHETDAEFEIRMERRAQRIARKTEDWDRNELAQRYAWMLLLACEFHKTERTLESLANAHEHMGNDLQRRADTLERIARDAMRKVMKTKNDRKRGATAKLAKDPKQAAKKEAFKEWQDWQTGRTIHKNQSKFAQYIVQKVPILENPKTVENWAREWREAKAKK